jgi:hypothetical protein
MSMTGVPSIVSIGPIRRRLPTFRFTVTGWMPIGLGRSGERVAKTPMSGRDGFFRGRTSSTSRRPWCSHDRTINRSPTAIPASALVNASLTSSQASGAPSSA